MYGPGVIELNDLLGKVEIDPEHTMVMRHRPTEPKLRAALGWFAEEEPEVYNAYQRIHGERVEKSLSKAKHLASFIGHEPSKALFVGLYAVRTGERIAVSQWRKRPENQRLLALGHREPKRTHVRWFDLELTENLAPWKGRMVVSWSGIERSWWRWASRNVLTVSAIHEESALVRRMPEWTELVLSWAELKMSPRSWRAVLSQWRGVYLILDRLSGKGYVGSAYGPENIMTRWTHYADTGHGGNVELKRLDPQHFQFAILERVSPDMPADEVIRIEGTWKNRLGTRDCGLNRN